MKPLTVGIVGAGQLGRMLALAGIPMGLHFEFLDSNPQAPAAALGRLHCGAFDDIEALKTIADAVDVLTFDVENVPAGMLAEAADKTLLSPPVTALSTAQDRLLEKNLFRQLGIPTGQFAEVNSYADLEAAAHKLGFPCVLKTRRLGYDGRGQVFLHAPEDLPTAWQRLDSEQLLLEQFIHFDAEVSLIAARGRNAQTVYYPLTHNTHQDGILRTSVAPFDNPPLLHLAQGYLHSLLEHFDYTGVLTIELFVTADGLLANEIAPRVHNSGHWTIEGAVTSQFENHLRAILGWPLGSTAPVGHSAMINFLGSLPDREKLLQTPRLHYHDYGKTPRPNRKIGHGTVVCNSHEECLRQLQRLTDEHHLLTR